MWSQVLWNALCSSKVPEETALLPSSLQPVPEIAPSVDRGEDREPSGGPHISEPHSRLLGPPQTSLKELTCGLKITTSTNRLSASAQRVWGELQINGHSQHASRQDVSVSLLEIGGNKTWKDRLTFPEAHSWKEATLAWYEAAEGSQRGGGREGRQAKIHENMPWASMAFIPGARATQPRSPQAATLGSRGVIHPCHLNPAQNSSGESQNDTVSLHYPPLPSPSPSSFLPSLSCFWLSSYPITPSKPFHKVILVQVLWENPQFPHQLTSVPFCFLLL